MSTTDWILLCVQGLVVIGFIALGVRTGGIGLGLWGGVGTLVLVFVFGLDPGEPPISAILIIIAVISAAAAMQAAGRRRLHGQDRERGLARASEVPQLRRPVRLVSPHDPHRHEQHVLLDHPGDQRGRVREQDPARAGACRVDGRQRARNLVEPGRGRDGDAPAARRDLQLRPGRRPPHHHPGEHRRHLRHVARDEPPRTGSRRRPGVPAPSGQRRGATAGPGRRHRACSLMPSAAWPSSSQAFLPSVCSVLSRGSGRPSPPKAAAPSRCR